MATTETQENGLPKSLKRVGIDSHEKALLVAPSGYRDYTSEARVAPAPDTGKEHFLRLTVDEVRFMTRFGMSVASDSKDAARVIAVAHDDVNTEVRVIAFGGITHWKKAKAGTVVHLYGELTTWRDTLQMKEPVLVPTDEAGHVVPVYKGKAGLTGADAIKKGVMLSRGAVVSAGSALLKRVGFTLDEFRASAGMTPEQLLADLHWPTDAQYAMNALVAAQRLSLKAVTAQVRTSREKPYVPGSTIKIDNAVARSLVKNIPFRLTKDQLYGIKDILEDLQSPYPMRRILSGDVGTGKSLTFMIPAVAAFKAGASVSIIAPGKLLVRQLADEIRQYFPGVPVFEVVGGEALPEEAGIVVGTTAVTIAAEAAGKTFDLVITDEQHKFSVSQRQVLLSENSNLLESTATAIPRTVALVSMGGMDVTMLKTCPVKKEIMSRVITRKKEAGLFKFVKEQIAQGGQVAVIYPLVESEDTDSTAEAALTRFAQFFGGRVGIIHGRQKADAKDETIRKMREGEIDVLISSTVIEVGLTLPSLKVMVVVNPEHFGASQLHQLRGRLARKGGKGYFFMFLKDNGSPKPHTAARLKLLVHCNDGFEVAAKDAELRGAGEVFDELGSQSGSTKSIFFGIDLSYADLERAVEEATSHGGQQRKAA